MAPVAAPPPLPSASQSVQPAARTDSTSLQFTPNRTELWRLQDAKAELQQSHHILSLAQQGLASIQANVERMVGIAEEAASLDAPTDRLELVHKFNRLPSAIDTAAIGSAFGKINLLHAPESDHIVVKLQIGHGRSDSMQVVVKPSDATSLGLRNASVATAAQAAVAQAVLSQALANLRETAESLRSIKARVDYALSPELRDTRTTNQALGDWRKGQEAPNRIAMQAKMRAMLNVLSTGRGLAESVTFLTS